MKNKYAWIAAVVWSLMILLLISIPGETLPQGPDIDYDKLGHFSLFLVFSLLWMQVGSSKYLPLWVLAGGLLYGITTEYYQGLLPIDRTPSPFDAAANVAGLLTGIAAGWYWKRRKRQGKSRGTNQLV